MTNTKEITIYITAPDLTESVHVVKSEAARRRLHAAERAALCARLGYPIDAVVTSGEMIGELRCERETGRRFR